MRKRFTPNYKAQVVRELLKEEKTLAQISTEYGVAATQLSAWKATALKGLPGLFENERKAVDGVKAEYERRLQELYSEIGRLTTQISWLKKNLELTRSRTERMQMLDWESDELTVQTQAELLGLHRSGLYYVPAQVSADELALKHRIDELYTRHPFFGSRRIAEELGINRKAAQRHMREMGLAAVYPKPNLSRRAAKAGIFPYLLRGLAISLPNQVFAIDITYIRMLRGWMYLVAVMDWYSRYVVSWEMDETLEMPFVLSAVEQALSVATPTIWNSDQGSHFTSPAYLSRLQTAHVAISMDGRGRVTDNIFIERLWRSVKYEEVYLNEYDSPRQARQRLSAYLEFYNHRRKHQALNYLTPAQLYAGLNRTEGRLVARLPN